MRGHRTFIAALIVSLLFGAGVFVATAQQSGGAFVPTFAYEGIYNFTRAFYCGTTATCGNTATAMTAHIAAGVRTLANGTATVTGISPAFTSTSTFNCVAVDTSGASGVVAEAVPLSASSITVNGTGTGTVSWLCVGY